MKPGSVSLFSAELAAAPASASCIFNPTLRLGRRIGALRPVAGSDAAAVYRSATLQFKDVPPVRPV